MEQLQLSIAKEDFFNSVIAQAEDERTELAQKNKQNVWTEIKVSHINKPTVRRSLTSLSREVSYGSQNFVEGIFNDTMGTQQGTRFRLKHNKTQFFTIRMS